MYKTTTTKENVTMDPLEMTNDEFGFDDNGLQEALLPSSLQKIVPNDSISETGLEDSPHSHCGAAATGRDGDQFTVQRESNWAVPVEDGSENNSVLLFLGQDGVSNNDEREKSIPADDDDFRRNTDPPDILDLSDCHMRSKKQAENLDGKPLSSIRSRECEVKEPSFQTGRSAKNREFHKSISHLTSLSLWVTFTAILRSTISWQVSFSITVGILFLMPTVGVEAALTSVPLSTLFVVGKTARINCSTDLDQPVYWIRILTGSDVQQYIHYGHDGFDSLNVDHRFSMDQYREKGRYDLIIADVQHKDAGQYVCVDESGLGAGASAELVVSEPISCNSSIPSDGIMGDNVFGLKEDLIQISCSLEYTGNLSPILQWSWPGSEMTTDERWFSAGASSVSSTLKLSPTKELNNVKFQCEASIEDATQLTVDSLWVSEPVNVRYAEFVPKPVSVCPGVEWNLVCNPQCAYSFERKGHESRCLYTYYDMRSHQSYQFTSHAVTHANYNNVRVVCLAVFAAVAALLLLTLGLVKVVCYLKKKTTNRQQVDDLGNSGPNMSTNDDRPSKAMLEELI